MMRLRICGDAAFRLRHTKLRNAQWSFPSSLADPARRMQSMRSTLTVLALLLCTAAAARSLAEADEAASLLAIGPVNLTNCERVTDRPIHPPGRGLHRAPGLLTAVARAGAHGLLMSLVLCCAVLCRLHLQPAVRLPIHICAGNHQCGGCAASWWRGLRKGRPLRPPSTAGAPQSHRPRPPRHTSTVPVSALPADQLYPVGILPNTGAAHEHDWAPPQCSCCAAGAASVAALSGPQPHALHSNNTPPSRGCLAVSCTVITDPSWPLQNYTFEEFYSYNNTMPWIGGDGEVVYNIPAYDYK